VVSFKRKKQEKMTIIDRIFSTYSMLQVLPKNDHQRPHKHQSVALDLCTEGPTLDSQDKGVALLSIVVGKCKFFLCLGKVYTLMGPELDEHGWVKNAIKVDWVNK
jgi:hypothetical protein